MTCIPTAILWALAAIPAVILVVNLPRIVAMVAIVLVWVLGAVVYAPVWLLERVGHAIMSAFTPPADDCDSQ